MKEERLAYEVARWMACQIAADCLELVNTPPEEFLAVPIKGLVQILRYMAISSLPWADQDIAIILGVLKESKLIVANHRPFVSSFSRVTIQHQQRADEFLEDVNFIRALDLVSKWEVSQPKPAGYIELGFISLQTIREALLVVFSTPKYYTNVKTRLGILSKMGSYTSPI